jgi:hypothetical protein
VLWICLTVYLGGWLAATIGVFVVGNRISEPGLPVGYRLLLSVAAGVIWPLLLIGAVEFTSMAMYSSAESMAVSNRPEFPEIEMDAEQTLGDIVPMH